MKQLSENRIASPARSTFLCFLSVLVLLFAGCPAPRTSAAVREPAVAGQFYPADSSALRLAVTRFMDEALPKRTDRPLAIIVPHAGYVYCGQIIADGFRQAQGQPYDLVVILGANHTTAGFGGVSVYTQGSFRTPLGDAVIDEEAAERLLDEDADCVFDPRVHEKEHSIEVEIPFVQTLFPDAKILPIVIGSPDLALCTRLGEALAIVLKDRRVLIVASSDLSHYPRYEDARIVDKETLKAVALLDAKAVQATIEDQMEQGIPELSTCACGEGPILTSIVFAKAQGANRATIVSYANSGDALVGTEDRVVGYGSVALSSDGIGIDTTALHDELPPGSAIELTRNDKKDLLTLARKSIEWQLTSQTLPLPRGFGASTEIKEGAFVTLKKRGELRGCIGHMAEDTPLNRVVGRMALAAAFEDQRFRPVAESEMSEITVEISALTPLKPIADASLIRVGTDGVVIRKEGRSAVFLPQVATEQGWSREEMLGYLCEKARLSSDAWKQGAQFFVFQAVVFSEDEFMQDD
jgi:AmmeMemoRadiSam system protein B/AmmeMemoRadiSam system protein A